MENIVSMVGELGGVGAAAAVLIYQVLYLQKHLVTTIRQNTEALQKVADVVAKCEGPRK